MVIKQHTGVYISFSLTKNTETVNKLNHTANTAREELHGSNDSRLHVVEPLRGRSFIWQIGVNSSIQDRRQVDRFFYGRDNADSLLNRAADHRTRLRPTNSAVSPSR